MDPDLAAVKQFRQSEEVKQLARRFNQIRDKVISSWGAQKGDDDFHNSINFYQAILEEAGFDTAPIEITRVIANGMLMGWMLAKDQKSN